MLGVVAVMKVQLDKTAEFEAVFREMTESVRKNEPNTVYYNLFRDRNTAGVYKVIEVYKTDADLEVHKGMAFKDLFPKVLPLLSEKPSGEFMEALF